VRDSWPVRARRIDYGPSLGKVRSPALICVGRHDPQAPPACSQELAAGIPDSRLVVFENSGHYPFIEERERFLKTLAQFYAEGALNYYRPPIHSDSERLPYRQGIFLFGSGYDLR
jgi:pimeloyl-ACP methyl ester carboxylesterase